MRPLDMIDIEANPLALDHAIEEHKVANEGPTAMTTESSLELSAARQQRSERFLATVAPYRRVILVSHVNPDPDSLASMLGLKALIDHCQPGKTVILTMDGMIARAENREMVQRVPIDLVPVETVVAGAGSVVVMVDTQPFTGRRASERDMPKVVLDHHETGGLLEGVEFRDIRPNLGATSCMAIPKGRQGSSGADPQSQAAAKPLRHVSTCLGERVSLRGCRRKLVRRRHSARHHRRDR